MAVPTPSDRRRRTTTLRLEGLEPRLAMATFGSDHSLVRLAAPPSALAPTAVHTALLPAITVVAPLAAQPAAAPTGLTTYTLQSEFQRGPTLLRVLAPDSYDPNQTYRTVYVLPVEPGSGRKYGDGLAVVQKANLHNVHGAIFVAPSFSDMPWYGDHPTKTSLRQESHLLRTVIPFVENTYAVSRQAADRLLVGFSKSGYGAFSLLLRHPDQFGKAVAWDAPLALGKPRSDWGMPKIFGSNANFGNYRVTRLIDQRAPLLATGSPRLILAGANTFRSDHAQVARQLARLAVPHVVVTGPRYGHAWGTGWLPAAIQQALA
ncbi:MAG: hypothetical protein RLZZ21_2202 [Planctomycetota bacterium]|jgi:hypothetical protein